MTAAGSQLKLRLKIVFLIMFAVLLSSCGGQKSKPIKIGDTLSPFAAQDIDGQSINLNDYMGKPVILRFFLIDCKFCIADTPAFNSYFNKHHQEGLQIIYINNDAPDIQAVREFAEKLAIPFPVISDPGGRIAAQYNVRVQPLTLLLDRDHRLLAALLGGVSEADLADIMGPYLQKKIPERGKP